MVTICGLKDLGSRDACAPAGYEDLGFEYLRGASATRRAAQVKCRCVRREVRQKLLVDEVKVIKRCPRTARCESCIVASKKLSVY